MQKSPSSLSKIGALKEKSRLKEMKAQSSDKLILGHLNITSIGNKFEALKLILGHLNINSIRNKYETLTFTDFRSPKYQFNWKQV